MQFRTLGVCAGTISCWLGIVSAADITLVPVVSGLDSPIYVTHSGDGSNRLFIVEQSGRILIWPPTSPLLTPFLDIRPKVRSGGESQESGTTCN